MTKHSAANISFEKGAHSVALHSHFSNWALCGKNMKKYLLSSEKFWEQIQKDFGGKAGVYRLHCFDEFNKNKLKPINRLLGIDDECILYIGKTAKNHFRIGDLFKALSPDYKSLGHHVGIRFSKNMKLRESFPFSRLCITFIQSEDPKKTESQELQKYFLKYGEVPPLNAVES